MVSFYRQTSNPLRRTSGPDRPLRSAYLMIGMGAIVALMAEPSQAIAPVDWSVQVTEVATWLTGRLEATVQPDKTASPVVVRMTTCSVQVDDATVPEPTVFLYQEQAMTDKLAAPYRQRFLQISPSLLSQTVRSLAFRPADLKPWRNFCQKPPEQRHVKLADLGQPICSVFLKRSGQEFVGSTPLDGCPANVRGAVRITNHIRLRSDNMTTWDRGFDAHGKQVWGAKTESYQFHKVSPNP